MITKDVNFLHFNITLCHNWTKKSLKIPKGQPKDVNWRRDNKITKMKKWPVKRGGLSCGRHVCSNLQLKSGLIRGIASPVGDMFVVIYI
jgi:hypothetical protein